MKLLTILFCGLLAFTYAQEEPSQFSDLIGQQAIVKAEKQLLSEDEEIEIETKTTEDEKDNEVELENGGFTSFFGLYDLDSEVVPPKENTSPSRAALGFGSKPMSFKQNFEKDFQFDKDRKSRVKRSRLNDLQAAASAQRFAGIDPAIIAQMFQRQLLIAEDAGLPLGYQTPDFHGHPFSMEMVFGLPMQGYYMNKYAHMLPFHGHKDKYHEPMAYHKPEPKYHPAPKHIPVVPVVPIAHKEPMYHDPQKHYLPPKHKGGSLEEVFGVATKYAHPPVVPVPHPGYKEMPQHYDYPKHNSYSLHYLPYEDYVPHHAETIALKNRVPSIPGAAHILVKAPHPHLRGIPHSPFAPLKKRTKRSAQGSY